MRDHGFWARAQTAKGAKFKREMPEQVGNDGNIAGHDGIHVGHDGRVTVLGASQTGQPPTLTATPPGWRG